MTFDSTPGQQRRTSASDTKRKRQISRAIDVLRVDPLRAPNIAPLHGELDGLYRLRVGEYRVVYAVNAQKKQVFILAVGPRGDIYK